MARILMGAGQTTPTPQARILKPAAPKVESPVVKEEPKTSFWGNLTSGISNALQPKDITKTKGVGETIGTTVGNQLKSLVKNVGGMVTYPVYQAPKSILEAGKEFGGEISGAIGDIKKGVNPLTLAKETIKEIPKQLGTVAKSAYETLAPAALQTGKGVEGALKSVAEDPFQILPYALMGKGAIEKVPGAEMIAKAPVKALKSTVEAIKSVPKKIGYEGVGIEQLKTPLTEIEKVIKFNKAVEEGVSKGIKPTTVGKPTLAKMQGFYDSAKTAVKTIAENKNNIKITDENGETVSHPKSSAQAAQAIDQAKKIVYDKYNNMSKAAGKMGATIDVQPAVAQLQTAANDIGKSPEIRKYAASLIPEIQELQGQSPEVIQARIQEYNQSLSGFYEGRVSKSKAQIDASAANLLRQQLDSSIENAQDIAVKQAQAQGITVDPETIKNYQELKNQYGSLKSIEKEVNKRALVNARKAGKSVIDMTDIFTGAELAAGLITGNIAEIGGGILGRGIKEYYKAINNPDRYIERMFKTAYDTVPETGDVSFKKTATETPQKPSPILPKSSAGNINIQQESALHIPEKNVFAKVPQEQMGQLTNEVKNIPFTKGDTPHLTNIEKLSGANVKEIPLSEIRKISSNIDEALTKTERFIRQKKQLKITDNAVVNPSVVKSKLGDIAAKVESKITGKITATDKLTSSISREIMSINTDNIDSPGQLFMQISEILKKNNLSTPENLKSLQGTIQDLFMMGRPGFDVNIYKKVKE